MVQLNFGILCVSRSLFYRFSFMQAIGFNLVIHFKMKWWTFSQLNWYRNEITYIYLLYSFLLQSRKAWCLNRCLMLALIFWSIGPQMSCIRVRCQSICWHHFWLQLYPHRTHPDSSHCVSILRISSAALLSCVGDDISFILLEQLSEIVAKIQETNSFRRFSTIQCSSTYAIVGVLSLNWIDRQNSVSSSSKCWLSSSTLWHWLHWILFLSLHFSQLEVLNIRNSNHSILILMSPTP